LDRWAGRLITKDGVTVAREVSLPDPVQNMGARILQDACLAVNKETGDGTTTTALLAGALMQGSHRYLEAGMDPGTLIQGVNAAAAKALEIVTSFSKPLKTQRQIERLALISSNGDIELASVLADAAMAIGQNGTISIEDGPGLDVTLEYKEGMEIDRGPSSMTFLGNRNERKLEGPVVAVIGHHLTSLQDVQEMLECASQWKPRELVVFALSVSKEALLVMTTNDAQGQVKSVAIQCPGHGPHQEELLQDIAAMAGATYVTRDQGHDLTTWDPAWFGHLYDVTVGENKTTLSIYDQIQQIEPRVAALQGQLKRTTFQFDQDQLQKRIAVLTGGLVVLRVGGVTETARKERRARVEDAMGAVKAALRGGVVPGGGMTLLRAYLALGTPLRQDPNYLAGWTALREALLVPFLTLVTHAGGSGEAVLQMLLQRLAYDENRWLGWDAQTKTIRDLGQDPQLFDPTNVVVASLRAALSVSTTLLTVETAVTRSSGQKQSSKGRKRG